MRIYKCEKCGLTIDRDRNAAINLLKMGSGRAPVERSPRGDIAWRINHIQDALGLSLTEFYEYSGIYQSQEEESNEDQDLTVEEVQAQREEKAESDGVWNLNPGTSEECSELDRKLLREELEAEEW